MPRLNRRVLIITLGTVVVAAASVFGLHYVQVNQQADFFLSRGAQAIAEGDPRGGRSLPKSGPDGTAKFRRTRRAAAALERTGNILGAFTTANRAERFGPDDAENNLRLAKLSLQIRRYADVVQRVKGLLPAAADNDRKLELLTLLGDAQAGDQDGAPAAAAFAEAIQLDEAKPITYDKLARVQSGLLNDADQAAATLDSMVQRFSNDSHAWILRGQWYLDEVIGQSPSMDVDSGGRLRRHLTQADQDADQAMIISAGDVDALRFATHVAMRAEDYDEVRQLAEQGISKFPNDADFYRFASTATSALAGQAVDEADQERLRRDSREFLQAGLAKQPNDMELLWAAANADLEVGRIDQVASLVDRLRKLGYPARLVRYLEAQLLAADGQNLAAAQQLELVRTDVIEVPAVVRLVDLSLADVYRDTGDVDRQIAVLRRVVTANDGWLPGRERLAIALLQSGRVDEAVQEYRSLASRAGLPITAPLNFARLLILQNLGRDAARQNWEPVTSLLEKLDQEEALAGEVAVLRAEMLSSQDRADEARQVLATAIETVDKASSEAVWSAQDLVGGQSRSRRRRVANARSGPRGNRRSAERSLRRRVGDGQWRPIRRARQVGGHRAAPRRLE